MEYMSAPQAAEKWGISERRVQILCSQNRIPKDAEKPTDARFKKRCPKSLQEETDHE